jgi:hypothetical protein
MAKTISASTAPSVTNILTFLTAVRDVQSHCVPDREDVAALRMMSGFPTMNTSTVAERMIVVP